MEAAEEAGATAAPLPTWLPDGQSASHTAPGASHLHLAIAAGGVAPTPGAVVSGQSH